MNENIKVTTDAVIDNTITVVVNNNDTEADVRDHDEFERIIDENNQASGVQNYDSKKGNHNEDETYAEKANKPIIKKDSADENFTHKNDATLTAIYKNETNVDNNDENETAVDEIYVYDDKYSVKTDANQSDAKESEVNTANEVVKRNDKASKDGLDKKNDINIIPMAMIDPNDKELGKDNANERVTDKNITIESNVEDDDDNEVPVNEKDLNGGIMDNDKAKEVVNHANVISISNNIPNKITTTKEEIINESVVGDSDLKTKDRGLVKDTENVPLTDEIYIKETITAENNVNKTTKADFEAKNLTLGKDNANKVVTQKCIVNNTNKHGSESNLIHIADNNTIENIIDGNNTNITNFDDNDVNKTLIATVDYNDTEQSNGNANEKVPAKNISIESENSDPIITPNTKNDLNERTIENADVRLDEIPITENVRLNLTKDKDNMIVKVANVNLTNETDDDKKANEAAIAKKFTERELEKATDIINTDKAWDFKFELKSGRSRSCAGIVTQCVISGLTDFVPNKRSAHIGNECTSGHEDNEEERAALSPVTIHSKDELVPEVHDVSNTDGTDGKRSALGFKFVHKSGWDISPDGTTARCILTRWPLDPCDNAIYSNRPVQVGEHVGLHFKIAGAGQGFLVVVLTRHCPVTDCSSSRSKVLADRILWKKSFLSCQNKNDKYFKLYVNSFGEALFRIDDEEEQKFPQRLNVSSPLWMFIGITSSFSIITVKFVNSLSGKQATQEDDNNAKDKAIEENTANEIDVYRKDPNKAPSHGSNTNETLLAGNPASEVITTDCVLTTSKDADVDNIEGTKSTPDDEEHSEVRDSSSIPKYTKSNVKEEVSDYSNTDITEDLVPLGFNSKFKHGCEISPDGTEAQFRRLDSSLGPHFVYSSRSIRVGEQVEIHFNSVGNGSTAILVSFTNEHPATGKTLKSLELSDWKEQILLNYCETEVCFKFYVNVFGNVITKINYGQQSVRTFDNSSPIWMLIATRFVSHKYVTAKFINSRESRQSSPGDENGESRVVLSNIDVAKECCVPLRFDSEHAGGWDVSSDGIEAKFNLFNLNYYSVSCNRPIEVGERVELHFKNICKSLAVVYVYLTNKHPASLDEDHYGNNVFSRTYPTYLIILSSCKNDACVRFRYHINCFGRVVSKLDDKEEQKSSIAMDINSPFWMILVTRGVRNSSITVKLVDSTASRQAIQLDGDNTITTAISPAATTTLAATSASMLAVEPAKTSDLTASLTKSITNLAVTSATPSALTSLATSTKSATKLSVMTATPNASTSSVISASTEVTTSATTVPITSTTAVATKCTGKENKNVQEGVTWSTVSRNTMKENMPEDPDLTNTDVAENRVPLGFSSEFNDGCDISPDGMEATFLKLRRSNDITHGSFVFSNRPVQIGEQVDLHFKGFGDGTDNEYISVCFTNKQPVTNNNAGSIAFGSSFAEGVYIDCDKKCARYKCHINKLGQVISKTDVKREIMTETKIDIGSPVWMFILKFKVTERTVIAKLMNSTASKQCTGKENKNVQEGVTWSTVTRNTMKENMREDPDLTNTDVAENRVPLGFSSEFNDGCDVSPDGMEATFLKLRRSNDKYHGSFVFSNRPVQIGEQVDLHFKGVYSEIINVCFTNKQPVTDNTVGSIICGSSIVEGVERVYIDWDKKCARYKCHINKLGQVISKTNDKREIMKETKIDIGSPVWMFILKLEVRETTVIAKLMNSTASKQGSHQDTACDSSVTSTTSTTKLAVTSTTKTSLTSTVTFATASVTCTTNVAAVLPITSRTAVTTMVMNSTASKQRKLGDNDNEESADDGEFEDKGKFEGDGKAEGDSESECDGETTSEARDASSPVITDTEKQEVSGVPEHANSDVTGSRVPLRFDSEYSYGWFVYPDGTSADIRLSEYWTGINPSFVFTNRPVEVGEKVELCLDCFGKGHGFVMICLTKEHPAVNKYDDQFLFSIRTSWKEKIALNHNDNRKRFKCHINSFGEVLFKINAEDEQKSAPTIDLSSPVWMVIWIRGRGISVDADFVNITPLEQRTLGNNDNEESADDGESEDKGKFEGDGKAEGDSESEGDDETTSEVRVASSPVIIDTEKQEVSGVPEHANGDFTKSRVPLRFGSKYSYGCIVYSNDTSAGTGLLEDRTFINPYFVFTNRPVQVGEQVELCLYSYGKGNGFVMICLTKEHPAVNKYDDQFLFSIRTSWKEKIALNQCQCKRFKCHINSFGEVLFKINAEDEQKSAPTTDLSSPVWMVIWIRGRGISVDADFVNITPLEQCKLGNSHNEESADDGESEDKGVSEGKGKFEGDGKAEGDSESEGDGETTSEVQVAASPVIIDTEKQEVSGVPEHANGDFTESRVPLGFDSKYSYGWIVNSNDTSANTGFLEDLTGINPYFVFTNRPVEVGEQVELCLYSYGKGNGFVTICLTKEHPAVNKYDDQFLFSIRTCWKEKIALNQRLCHRFKCHINSFGEVLFKINAEDEQKSAPTIDLSSPVWMVILLRGRGNFVYADFVNISPLEQGTQQGSDSTVTSTTSTTKLAVTSATTSTSLTSTVTLATASVTCTTNVAAVLPITSTTAVTTKCTREDKENGQVGVASLSVTTTRDTNRELIAKGNSLESATVDTDNALPADTTTDTRMKPAADIDDNDVCSTMTTCAHFSKIVENLLEEVPNDDRLKCMIEILKIIDKIKETPK